MSSNNFFLHLHFCMILLCKERERNKYQTNLFWRVAKEATFEPFHFNFAIFEAQYLSMGWRIQTFFYLIGLCIIHFLPSCLFNQNEEKEYTAREREQKKRNERDLSSYPWLDFSICRYGLEHRRIIQWKWIEKNRILFTCSSFFFAMHWISRAFSLPSVDVYNCVYFVRQ